MSFFYNGLHLEAGIAFVFEHMQKWKNIVAVTDTIDRSLLHAPPEFKGNYDPHVWFNVRMWMKAVEVVRDTLVKMDPASQEYYQQNAQDYLAQMEELDTYVREQAQRVPADKRVLITAHDAFNYF
jgi:manganese/zinc/iron transport system substrate-binding protein